MSDESMDALDNELASEFASWDDEDGDPHDRRFGERSLRRLPTLKTCNRCGTSGLYWKETLLGWRLHNGDGLHTCPSTRIQER